MNDDKKYINAIKKGEVWGFDKLYYLYGDRLMSYATRLTQDNDIAYDAVQAAFIKLWTKPPLFLKNNTALPWLYRVTWHYILDYFKYQKKFIDLDDIDNHPSLDNFVDITINKIYVAQLLDKIPIRQRTAIILFYYDGFSQKEAANIMNVNIRAFESLLARGRKFIKENQYA